MIMVTVMMMVIDMNEHDDTWSPHCFMTSSCILWSCTSLRFRHMQTSSNKTCFFTAPPTTLRVVQVPRKKECNQSPTVGFGMQLLCFPVDNKSSHTSAASRVNVPLCRKMVEISKITPLKFNMEPENQTLEKEIPFGNHHFQVPC